MLQPFCWLDHILLCTVVVSIYNKNTQFGWNLETIVLIPVVMSWGVWLLVSPRLRNDLSNSSERVGDLWHFIVSGLPVTWKSVSVHHLLSSHSCVLEAFCSHTDLKMMAGLCLILYIKTAITTLSYNITTYYTGSNLFNKSYVHAYCSHRNEK